MGGDTPVDAAASAASGPLTWLPRLQRCGRWRWIGLLLGVALLLRAPIFVYPLFNGDEATYSALGNRLLEGHPLYVGAVDHKPPGIAATYAVLLGIFGRRSLDAVHLASILVVVATAAALAALAQALGRTRREARWAGLLYVLFASMGPGKDMLAANAELFMLLPGTLAPLVWFRRGARPPTDRRVPAAGSSPRRWLAPLGAGALCCCAYLYKYQGGAVAGALVIGLGLDALRGRQRWSTALADGAALALGFLAPIAAVVGLYAAGGHLRDLTFWAWIYPLRYAGKLPLAAVLGNALKGTGMWAGPSFALIAAAVLGMRASWAEARRPAPVEAPAQDGGAPPAPATRALFGALWLFWSAVGVVAGGRFFLHYYLQVIPPLALLAGPVVARLGEGSGGPRPSGLGRWAAAAAVGASTLGLLAFWGANAWDHRLRPRIARHTAAYRAVGAWVRQHSPATAQMLVWGNSAEIYHFGARRMGTRFPFCNYHSGKIWGTPADEEGAVGTRSQAVERAWTALLEDLDRRLPEVLVDAAAGGLDRWSGHALQTYPRLASVLQRDYRLATRVAGVRIYLRRDLAGSPGGDP